MLRQQGGALEPPLRVRLAVSSGEVLVSALLAELQQVLPRGCHILNLYGSTEVAADCTAFDCTAWQPGTAAAAAGAAAGGSEAGRDSGQLAAGTLERVPVGQPIGGTLVVVLEPAASEVDEGPGSGDAGADPPAAPAAAAGQRTVVPLGRLGDVAVAGVGLAAGYLRRHPAAAAAQAQRFVDLPTAQLRAAQQAGGSVAAAPDLPAAFWEQDSTRVFLTGDLGWLDSGGCLHLAGRRDHQVKISGGSRAE